MNPATTPLRRFVLTALALSLAGCGAAPPANFPTRQELDELATAPPPERVLDDKAIDADAWELRGPLPNALDAAAIEDASPWGKTLSEAVAAKPGLVVASKAMGCVAREVAAFVAEKGGMPARPIQGFIAARCGVPTSQVVLASQSGTVPEKLDEPAVFNQWGPQVKAMVHAGLGAGNRFAGLAFVRRGERAAVVLATAHRAVHLESTPLVPTGGKVVLRGELLSPAASVRALVNRGRFGYAECATDASVRLPGFSIECPVAAEDASAWVEMAAFPAGRVLGNTVVEARVFPAGKPDNAYARAGGVSGSAPLDKVGILATLLARINAVRSEAGLGAVRVSEGETRTADRLAPHYFAAIGGVGDEIIADKVALGVLAGWDVEGMVREGRFTSVAIGARNPEELLESAFARPFGRQTLLNPEVNTVAVGTVVPPGGKGLGVMFGTYALMGQNKQGGEEAAVMARLAKLRQAKRLGAPAGVPGLSGVLAKAVARVGDGESPGDTLGWLVDRSAEVVRGARVQAWVAQGASVERIDFPAELLSAPGLTVAVGVAHHRPKGEPWARVVVFMVTVGEATVARTARVGGVHGG